MRLRRTADRLAASFPGAKPWVHFPALMGFIAFSAGIIAGSRLDAGAWVPVGATSIVLVAVSLACAVACPLRLPRGAAWFLSGVLLLGLHTARYAERVDMVTTVAGGTVRARGTPATPPTRVRGMVSYRLRVDSISSEHGSHATRGFSLIVRGGPLPPQPHGRVDLIGTIRPPRKPMNPGGFDERGWMESQGLAGRFYVDSALAMRTSRSPLAHAAAWMRATTAAALEHVNDPDARSVFRAAFLGDRTGLLPSTQERFRNAGIYHLLAISGLHVGMLAAFMFALLSLLHLGRPVKIMIVILFLWLYAAFIGPIPSLFRAVLMTTALLGSFLVQRRSYALNSLGLAGLLWLALSPTSLFQPGFQLSFSATFGILLLLPAFRQLAGIGRTVRSPRAAITVTFLVSLAGFLATAPVLATHFNTLNPVGLGANLLAGAAMTAAMWLFLAGVVSQIVIPLLTPLLMAMASLAMSLLDRLASLAASVPGGSVTVGAPDAPVVWVYASVLVGCAAVRTELRRPYLFRTVPVIALLWAGSMIRDTMGSETTLVLFRDRHGPVTGVRWPRGNVWLIGTGGGEGPFSTARSTVKPWVSTAGGASIEALLLITTRGHTVPSVEPLVESYHPRMVVSCMTGAPFPDLEHYLDRTGVKFHRLDRNDMLIPHPGCTCTVLHAPPGGSTLPAALAFSVQGRRFVLDEKGLARKAHDEAFQRIWWEEGNGEGPCVARDGAVRMVVDRMGVREEARGRESEGRRRKAEGGNQKAEGRRQRVMSSTKDKKGKNNLWVEVPENPPGVAPTTPQGEVQSSKDKEQERQEKLAV